MGNLVVKSNSFIGASYGLGLVEQRLILLAILKARESNNPDEVIGKRLAIHASDYMAEFGTDRTTAYRSLQEAVNGLYESEYVFIELTESGKQKTHRNRFTSSIAYSEGLGLVELTFAPETVPMIIGLHNNFTKYEIEQITKLKSKYALRLYELLVRWKDTGKFIVKIEDLRFKFGLLDDEHKRMDNFKRKVLDLSIQEINEFTDITLSYTQKKQGRVIIGFEFTIKKKPKPKPKDKPDRDPNTIDLLDNKTNKEQLNLDDITPRNDQEQEIINNKNVYADSKGITDPLHRHNLIKKGLEQYRQVKQLEQQKEEQDQNKSQAEKSRKQAEEKAKENQEQLEKEQAEQRKNNMITKFESLSQEEQERILDEVATKISGPFSGFYETARANGTAHKNVMFMGYFYQIFGY